MPKIKIQDKSQISFCKILFKKIVLCESTSEEVSFEWSHHRISLTDSKVRSTLTDSGSERVNFTNHFHWHEPTRNSSTSLYHSFPSILLVELSKKISNIHNVKTETIIWKIKGATSPSFTINSRSQNMFVLMENLNNGPVFLETYSTSAVKLYLSAFDHG